MADTRTMKKFRPHPRNIAVAATLVVAFVVMASIFVPGRTQAVEENSAVPSEAYSAESRENMALIGELEGEHYTVKFYATPYGPLYSVYGQDGAELADLLTAADLADRFPDLPLTDAHADVPYKTMGTDVGPNW